jgi:hypothetical protein
MAITIKNWPNLLSKKKSFVGWVFLNPPFLSSRLNSCNLEYSTIPVSPANLFSNHRHLLPAAFLRFLPSAKAAFFSAPFSSLCGPSLLLFLI